MSERIEAIALANHILSNPSLDPDDWAKARRVARYQFALHVLDGVQRQRQGKPDLAAGPLQPGEMRGAVHQPSVQHGGDFVDAVGEQKTAIQHGHVRLGKGQERAVHIGDRRQGAQSVAKGEILRSIASCAPHGRENGFPPSFQPLR